MLRIYKYELQVTELVQNLILPEGAQILTVQHQSGSNLLSLWAEIDTNVGPEARQFRVYGTGQDLEEESLFREYIGTVQVRNYVWHVFELIRSEYP